MELEGVYRNHPVHLSLVSATPPKLINQYYFTHLKYSTLGCAWKRVFHVQTHIGSICIGYEFVVYEQYDIVCDFRWDNQEPGHIERGL